MGRSLCVASSHIARAKQALKSSPYSSQQALATECGLGRDTARKFFNGEPIDRNNFIEFCERLNLDWQEIVKEDGEGDADPDFVGRKGAMTHLDQLRQAGKTCVLIQGPGGVGKTVLAERYLAARFPGRLVRFDVAKERQAVGSASGLLESKLKELGEEPGREFAVSCDRLRSKLQSEAYGVLVDNLEPALDGSGRLIPEHREYVELLRVLSDASLKSLTLITSRERVSENLNIELYRLDCLTAKAWGNYFRQKNLNIDSPVLAKMHEAYRGNALAMRVLRGRIASDDYQGNIEAYWADCQTQDGIVVVQDMENLIAQQFERLQQVNLNAYNLLCRMGCFRFQDVQTVPREGLFCLLWEVPQNKAQKAIDTLRDLALVDRVGREYRLHPLIREQAIERLKSSENWKRANQEAAKFWTNKVILINTEEDAITAMEAYHHGLEIKDFNYASDIISKERNNIYGINEPLGCSCYRLGLLSKICQSINSIKDKVSMSYSLSRIYNILGDVYWIMGNLDESILSHEKSANISQEISQQDHDSNTTKKINRVYSVSFFNKALYKLEFLDFQEAIKLCEIYFLLSGHSKLEAYSLMAFCHSCLDNKKQSQIFLKQAISSFAYQYNSSNPIEFCLENTPIWAIGYHYIFTGKVYYNLGQADNSKKQYNTAIAFSEKTNFLQLKAKSFTGLGEIYTQSNFKTALSYHTQSIEILKKIDAKCDLAEAYYQIALTYQAMGDTSNSQDYFNQSIALWQKIDVPKQIERIQKSMNTPPQ
ncbi:hypothetical protein PN441_16100 [Spirulina major CS-329]|uniref:tetratricopeptide repeat protein n=1 Tax=Spirulina TaxID=1154 RepID=UPI00232B0EC3|nr:MULTISPECIES: hypothetical protein [Spirulina]MDB9495108.1 hypothetical protein [Spirulina subsalsa CS-330]MDB9504601.1 hypothetical protein [Spirulina major CS-329]